MSVNQVVIDGKTVLDLTSDSVSENALLAGATAHNAAGENIEGKVVVAPIDTALSSTSTNPVQNKAIYAEFANIRAEMEGAGEITIDTALSSTSTNPVQNKIIKAALDALTQKVNKAAAAGDIKLTARTTAPTGWLMCNGAAVSRTTYAALFSAIGTTYGAGNGSTTFNLPDLRGRVAAGYNSSETEFNAVGKKGGEKTHTLTVAELPAHTHEIPYGEKRAGSSNYFESFSSGWSSSVNTATNKVTKTTGGGTAHNILQPYMALNYIICTGG